MRVSLIVFEINEIDGLREMMPRIKKEWYDELIIVDGGSADGSIEYAKKYGYNLFVQKKKGVGAALNEALQKVTGDIIVIYAPDGSFLPEMIPVMINKIKEGNDLAIVSRYCPGARSYDDTVFTALANRAFTGLANLFFRCKLTDFLYTYLAFKSRITKDLDITTDAVTWGQTFILRAVKQRLKIVEIPGIEHPRIGGRVKVRKLSAAFRVLFTILEERFLIARVPGDSVEGNVIPPR